MYNRQVRRIEYNNNNTYNLFDHHHSPIVEDIDDDEPTQQIENQHQHQQIENQHQHEYEYEYEMEKINVDDDDEYTLEEQNVITSLSNNHL